MWKTSKYTSPIATNSPRPINSAGSVARTRSIHRSKSSKWRLLGGRWTPAILLAIHVMISAAGSTMQKSMIAAAARFQNPTTYTLGTSRLTARTDGSRSRVGRGAGAGGEGVSAPASRSTAGSRSDIVDLYGAARLEGNNL